MGPFEPTIKNMNQVTIIAKLTEYDCPYSSKTHLLMVCNNLQVKIIVNNLLPSFILRESEIEVSDTP